MRVVKSERERKIKGEGLGARKVSTAERKREANKLKEVYASAATCE